MVELASPAERTRASAGVRVLAHNARGEWREARRRRGVGGGSCSSG